MENRNAMERPLGTPKDSDKERGIFNVAIKKSPNLKKKKYIT